MRNLFYVLILLISPLLHSNLVCAADVWGAIYTDDFGGNEETDAKYGPLLEKGMIVSSFESNGIQLRFDYDTTLMYGYCVLKHVDKNADWYTGGDHTYANDRDKGYFLLVNPGDSEKKEPAYSCKLTNLVKGNAYRFTAYVANMLLPHTNAKTITLSLGVYMTSDPNSALVSEKAYKTIELNTSNASVDSQSLDWQELQLEFNLENTLSEAYFILSMEAPKSAGWDFAIDDISVETRALISEEVSYCQDSDGNPLPYKVVWQEDFGTFTSGSTYWRWDYSDIRNPKKVMCTNAKQWTTAYDSDVESTLLASNNEYDMSPNYEGKYCVAANVTSEYDGLTTGTQWGWEAYFGNGQTPGKNGWTFAPDHTYGAEAYGGMLFVNYNGKKDEVIYSTVIKGLEQTYLTARCFLNTFSYAENPAAIYLRLTDLKSGQFVESDVVTNYSHEKGVAWSEVSASIDFAGSELKLEIVSASGGDFNLKGNDMVIDDIQLLKCGDFAEMPKVEITSENDSLFIAPIENVWGESVMSLGQYSFTPEDDNSWMTFYEFSGISYYVEFSSLKVDLTQFDMAGDSFVYVRMVVGPKEVLSQTDTFDPSNSSVYSVSNILAIPLEQVREEPFVSTLTELGKFVVTWERFEEASSYVLTIFTDTTMQDTVAIFEFDDQGNVVSSNILRAGSESDVMSYTLTNLTSGSYYYTMEAKNGAAVVAKNSASFVMPENVSSESAKSETWMVYVDGNELNILTPEAGTVKVTDICGNLVSVSFVEAGSSSGITLPAGVYFVTLNAEVKKVLVY